MAEREVVVVGAGLAGLACASALHRAGRAVRVLEVSNGVGGRVRTDRVDGFQLDRGFQVLNTGYPEARRVLDLDALDLRYFDSAVTIRRGGRLHRVANPLQAPTQAATLLGAPVDGVRGRLALAAYVARAATLPVGSLLRRDDVPGPQAWHAAGIPDQVVRDVLTPFLTGVVLERQPATSRRFLDLMVRMFARGRTAVPAAGMQAMPEQLAARLPADAVRLETAVEAVDRGVVVVDGREQPADVVVVATDPWTAHRLLPGLGAPPAARGVTTHYHAAPPGTAGRATLVVDADGSGVANSMVLTAAAPEYSRDGRDLVATSVVHDDSGPTPDGEALLSVLAELHERDTSAWQPVASYDLPHALPAMPAPHPFRRPVQVAPGVLVAGDHRDTSSIQGALVSGRRAAEAVLHHP